jgi:GntR family transcriptional regulator, rspAB operon transcriptional repressor
MTRPVTGSRSQVDVLSMFAGLTERRTMTDAVYDQLKTAIVELRIPPGEPLREADIAHGLSVSKTPVREALARLEQDGLVELNSFRSAVVTDYTARDLREIYELREIIEVAAARSAAESISDQGLADLGRVASECVRLSDEGGGPELVGLISEFDTVLFDEVGNRRIRAILANLAAHLTRIGLLTAGIPGRNAASVREHARIYEAIERRDPEAAERFMRQHIRSVRDDQLRALSASERER